MITRIEQAVERIALGALHNVSESVEPALNVEKLKKNFYARWPKPGSKFPMNDAMNAAARAAIAIRERRAGRSDETMETWKPPVAAAFDREVSNAVAEYFDKAQAYFAKAQPLAGTEALVDAVVSAMGFIAATREWPHATEVDLHDTMIALACGSLPRNGKDAYKLLDNASEEGWDLCSAFLAAMGQPASVGFGLFYDSQDGSNEDASNFARRTITLSRKLAGQEAVPF